MVSSGGGDRHALIVEHQLRPLFGFFEAFALSSAIYATDHDFDNGIPVSEPLLRRVAQAVGEAETVFSRRAPLAVAAE